MPLAIVFLLEFVSPEMVRRPRLFPRLPSVAWERRIHEDVLRSLARLGIQRLNMDITIEHTGDLDVERNEPGALATCACSNCNSSRRPATPGRFITLACSIARAEMSTNRFAT